MGACLFLVQSNMTIGHMAIEQVVIGHIAIVHMTKGRATIGQNPFRQ